MIIWIVATYKDGGKNYSRAESLNNHTELNAQMKQKGIKHAHLCETKKAAIELAMLWNMAYVENGTYMF